jgi:hypothetical protein
LEWYLLTLSSKIRHGAIIPVRIRIGLGGS